MSESRHEDASRSGPIALAGQVVLVTGGARRVGRAICLTLAEAGARVVVHHHRSESEARELAERLGGGALTVGADLRSAESTRAMFAQIREATGRLDGLVNNAAVFGRTPLRTLTDEEWDEQLLVNLTAPQRCIRHAVALGVRAVVNLVDIAAWQPWAEFSAYAVAKAGLLHLTKVLARELAPAVRVCAVAPGVALFADDAKQHERERVVARIPLGSAGTKEDVARAVRYLLTEPYLTGICIPVDGGQGLR